MLQEKQGDHKYPYTLIPHDQVYSLPDFGHDNPSSVVVKAQILLVESIKKPSALALILM